MCGDPSTGAGEGSACRPGRRRGRQRHLSLARTGRSRLHATRSRRAVGLSVCPTGMGAPPAADSAGRRRALPLSSLPNEGTAPRDTVLASHRSLRATEKEIPVSREDGLGSPMGDLVTAEGQGPARGPEAEPTTAEPARHLAPRGSAQRGGRLSPAPAPPSRHPTSRERRGPRARRTPSPGGSQRFTCNTND